MTLRERKHFVRSRLLELLCYQLPLERKPTRGSIFAQSGKMTTEQARGSYTFETRALELFGHQHSNPPAGGNDEVQRLCGKTGVARGKEK